MLSTVRFAFFVCLLVLTSLTDQKLALARRYQVASPNGELKLSFEVRDGKPTYALARSDQALITASRLGIKLTDQPGFSEGLQVVATRQTSYDDTWTQPWGERKKVRNNYNQLWVKLQQSGDKAREMILVFRVFNDGLGFRYEWPKQHGMSNIVIADELTEFNLAEDSSAWWIPGYEPERYEYLFKETKVSDIGIAHTPVTFVRSDDVSLSIHEAALVDYASMTLEQTEGARLKANLVPWSDGTKVKATLPFKSPWRTIQVAGKPGDLITSSLILNLNEPNKLADTSWIKPGKFAGVWWEMHLNKSTWGSGPHHGATTENVKHYIDFAAENGFQGVLAEGWNQGWDGDWTANGDMFSFTKPYPDFDLDELTRYAKQQGVELVAHNETAGSIINYENQLSEAFKFYQDHGIHTLKTGYVKLEKLIKRLDDHNKETMEYHHGQHMVRHYQKVVEEAAKHQIMLDVHEPIKPTGLQRTYPNLMTGEGARGQEYDAWSPDGGNPPDHTTVLPFTRLLAGPMDFTPGIFDVLYPELRPNNRVNTTLAKQLALYVVLYSPLQMVPDLPENYAAHEDAFQFIRDVPCDWQETRVLHGKIGDYVTIVRQQRDGEDWYLGSITDENARTLETPLSFLDPQRKYLATIYRDADDANWKTEPTKYVIEKREVDSKTVLQLALAPGGGQAIRFTPLPADSSELKTALKARNR
jgi:alpha-glucosidase